VRISKRSIGLAGLLALIAAAMLAFAVTAVGAKGPKGPSGGQGDGWIIRATLAPSLPTDPVLNGVSPGNAPWVLQRGEVRLKADGTFNLRLRGLVIPNPPGDGTPGPVTTV